MTPQQSTSPKNYKESTLKHKIYLPEVHKISNASKIHEAPSTRKEDKNTRPFAQKTWFHGAVNISSPLESRFMTSSLADLFYSRKLYKPGNKLILD